MVTHNIPLPGITRRRFNFCAIWLICVWLVEIHSWSEVVARWEDTGKTLGMTGERLLSLTNRDESSKRRVHSLLLLAS